MKKNNIILTIFVSLFFTSLVSAETKSFTNPQSMLVGARSISLGTSPLISGDISNSILNPATLAEINQYPLSVSSHDIFGYFDYFLFSTGFPKTIKYRNKGRFVRRKIGFSASYANISLNNIPKVTTYNSLPYQVGTFNAGFNVGHLGVGTNFYEKLQFNKISIGMALKMINYYVGSSSSYGGGLDAGIICHRYFDFNFINSVEIGGAIHNFISSSLTISETGNTGLLPLSYYIAVKINTFSDLLQFHSVINDLGVNVGAEYEVIDDLFMRFSTNFGRITYGCGIIIEDIPMGVGGYDLRGRLDFAYIQGEYPVEQDESYVFSVTSLGRSIPKQPEILSPSQPVVLTAEREVDLTGVGPKNTTIRIYNNDKFYRTTVSNRYGSWRIKDLPIFEGENHLYIKSYDIASDFSIKSNEVIVISDTEPPNLDVNIFPDNSILNIFIQSNEKLANLTAELEGVKLRFKVVESKEVKPKDYQDKIYVKEDDVESEVSNIYLKPTRYRALTELPVELQEGAIPPSKMTNLQLYATDESGNAVELPPINFFGSLSFPVDKHVHYKESLIAIGDSSDMLKSVYINKNLVYIDPNNKFSFPVELEPGKNVLELTFETNEMKVLNFYSRILRLVTYNDMTPKVKGRREIEFLSTLGLMFGDDDGNFYPTRNVTRQFLTKLMVEMLGEEIEEDVMFDLFDDIPSTHPYAKYIQAGINLGLIFAFPDGNFRPNQELSLTEVIYLMSNAGLIGFEEVEEEEPFVTRAQLAEFLAYTPRFERKIERLIDWEKGYEIKTQ